MTKHDDVKEFEVGDLVSAEFKNFAGQDIQVLGKIREIRSGMYLCNEIGTEKTFFLNSGDSFSHATPYEISQNKRCSHPLNNKKANGTCGICGLKVHQAVESCL